MNANEVYLSLSWLFQCGTWKVRFIDAASFRSVSSFLKLTWSRRVTKKKHRMVAAIERSLENDYSFFIVMGILFIIVALATALFSLITLSTIITSWHPHCRSVSNFLVANSCLATLVFDITISIQIPYFFHIDLHEDPDHPTAFCRMRGFLFLLGCIAKMCSYLIQAISRYFFTVLYKRKSLLTYRTNASLILAGWIYSLILACTLLVSPVAFQYEIESRLCVMTSKIFHTSFTLMVLAFVIPVNIIICLYGSILWHTFRSNQIQPSAVERRNNKRNIKVFQNILMLLGIVLVGGTPFVFSTIINRIGQTPWPWYAISIFFIVLSTAVESLLVLFTNKEVRRVIIGRCGLTQADQRDVVTSQAGPTVVSRHPANQAIPVIPNKIETRSTWSDTNILTNTNDFIREAHIHIQNIAFWFLSKRLLFRWWKSNWSRFLRWVHLSQSVGFIDWVSASWENSTTTRSFRVTYHSSAAMLMSKRPTTAFVDRPSLSTSFTLRVNGKFNPSSCVSLWKNS